MVDVIVTEYDGCGMCLVGNVRLSRKTDTTSSPERQRGQILSAVAECGGHIIAWAEDLEVSGATDPFTRPQLGPWLRGEMGPYDGAASASVDRVGRDVRETLNTQDVLTKQGRKIITADHRGVWDFADANQENEWLIKAWGSQMELRAIQKRNRIDVAPLLISRRITRTQTGHRPLMVETTTLPGDTAELTYTIRPTRPASKDRRE